MTASLPLPGLRHDVLVPLALRRDDGPVAAALCLAGGPALQQHPDTFLHPDERARLETMAEKRVADFIAGRYAAKRAIAQLAPDLAASTLAIVPGVFGQPVLRSSRALGLQVSISHGAGIGAALATPDTHPMALDLEHYLEASCATIATQLSAAELALAASLDLARVKALTLLWTMKEALSKVLRCGLTVPGSVLEVERIERAGVHLTGWFRHFSQYRAVAIDLGPCACALVLPRASDGLALDALLPAFATT